MFRPLLNSLPEGVRRSLRGLRDTEASRRRVRQQHKGAMPRVTLDERHTNGAALLPTRQALLSRIPPLGVACEIGVARGDFSADILKINRPRKLHLVDAWAQARYVDDMNALLARFPEEMGSGAVEVNRGLSTAVLPKFSDGYFDWVYIDTNHTYTTTAAELRICKQKVKPGGRIAGHDFCTGNVVAPVPYGVIEACNEFCVRENWRYEYISLDTDGHFSFCLIEIR